jgi:hypothetical protein
VYTDVLEEYFASIFRTRIIQIRNQELAGGKRLLEELAWFSA